MQKYFHPVFTAIFCGTISVCLVTCVCFSLLGDALAYVISISSAIIICFFICMIIQKKIGHNINNTVTNSSDDSKNDVISVIAHEMRSPITSVKGYLCALSDGIIPPEQQKQYIDIAINESERAIKTLENLMSLTKFDSGSIKLNVECFDINELIRLVIIEKINDIEQKNISIDTEFENEQIFVSADSNLIKQVIINLTDNAIKYNNANGKIKFSVTTNDGKALISVSDNGIGIEEDILPHIWERFYQADSSNGISYKGHGLGLCIVKEIIAAHNETISAQNNDEAGTTFVFKLSLAENQSL